MLASVQVAGGNDRGPAEPADAPSHGNVHQGDSLAQRGAASDERAPAQLAEVEAAPVVLAGASPGNVGPGGAEDAVATARAGGNAGTRGAVPGSAAQETAGETAASTLSSASIEGSSFRILAPGLIAEGLNRTAPGAAVESGRGPSLLADTARRASRPRSSIHRLSPRLETSRRLCLRRSRCPVMPASIPWRIRWLATMC